MCNRLQSYAENPHLDAGHGPEKARAMSSHDRIKIHRRGHRRSWQRMAARVKNGCATRAVS